MAYGFRPAIRPASVAAWLAALVLLAGCGPGGPFAPAPPPPRPQVQRPAARPVQRPAPPRPVAPQPDLPAPEQPPVPAPSIPLPSLARMPAGQVEAVLGEPSARVASGAGERWSYRGPGCTLDLFLFPDMVGGGLVVLDRRAGGASEQECLRRMRDGA